MIYPVAPPSAGRVAAGFGYPLTGLAWVLILGAAIVQPIPFGSIIASIVTSVYTLAIIRKSSEGFTTAPPLGEMGNPAEFIIRFLKMLVVTLVSAWPIFLAIPLIFVLRSAIVGLAAGVVMILYYPAAVATLAKWDSIKIALTPAQIFRFIGVLGADYFIALVMLFVALLVAAGVGIGVGAMTGSANVANVLSMLLFTWASFYFFHLVGWGMYRHRDELQ